eukprot:PhM_4_TR18438/c0_g1_i3/m.60168
MHRVVLFIVLLVLVVIVDARPPESFDPRRGLVLTSHTFDAAVNSHSGPWFIIYHVEWCGHCKRMKPIVAEASEHDLVRRSVNIGFIDCIANEPLCKHNDVHSYPGLRYRHHAGGDWHRYAGGHTLEKLVQFLDKLSRKDLGIEPIAVLPARPRTESGVTFVLTNVDTKDDAQSVGREAVLRTMSFDNIDFAIATTKRTSPPSHTFPSIQLISDVYGFSGEDGTSIPPLVYPNPEKGETWSV